MKGRSVNSWTERLTAASERPRRLVAYQHRFTAMDAGSGEDSRTTSTTLNPSLEARALSPAATMSQHACDTPCDTPCDTLCWGVASYSAAKLVWQTGTA